MLGIVSSIHGKCSINIIFSTLFMSNKINPPGYKHLKAS